MAQDITIAGATFNSVPSIVVPTANNGSAIFVDPSPTTAVDSDVASGKVYFKSDGSQSTGTASGGGGGGLVYETGTYTPTSDTEQPTISFANAHTEPPFYALIYDSTGTSYTTANTNKMFEITAPYYLDPNSQPALAYYGRTSYLYRSSSANSGGGTNLSSTSSSGNAGLGYYVSNSQFKPFTNSTTRYWRSGRTYKWIAVWKPTT